MTRALGLLLRQWLSENDSQEPRSSIRYRALALPFIVLSVCLLVGYQVTMALYKSAFKDTDQLVLMPLASTRPCPANACCLRR